MSDYSPPSEDLPIFDVNVFLTGDEPLTYNQAKKKFLRYPSAQGKETLQEIDVNGLATFNNNVVVNEDTGNIITVNYTGASQTNNGIVMNNAGITQQGTNINSITNTLKQTTITKSGTSGSILSVNFDNSAGGTFNNTGLTINNAGITQTGSQISGVTNTLASTKILNGSGFTIDNNSILFINALATPASANYRLSCYQSLNMTLGYFTSTTGTTSDLIKFNTNSSIAITPPITNSSTMPASSDSSTRVPTTAWVQGAITAGAGGPNLSKNSYTVSPTSSILGYTSGIFNSYNTGATIGYVSRESTYINSSVGYLTRNPLIISIVNTTGAPPNSSTVGNQTPSFSPLTNPVKISIDVFMYNNAGSTGYLRTKLMLLPSCCFTVSNQGWTGWGKYDISTETNGPSYFQNYAYALDNRINGNSAFTNNDATYCPYKISGNVPTPPSPALVASPSFTGRQCWSYDTSISSGLGISVLGMTYGLLGTNNIYVWFSGLTADNTTVFNVNAKIEDSSGANIMNNGKASSVSLSYLIPPPQP